MVIQSGLQSLPQVPFRPRQSTHDRSDRDFQHFGDLLVTEVLKIEQDERGAKLLGKCVESGLNRLGIDCRVVAALFARFGLLVQRREGEGSLSPQAFTVYVPNDGDQPRPGFFRFPKLVEFPVCGQKRLLHKVFGVGCRSGQSIGEAVEQLVMLVHKTSYGARSLAVIHGILYHIRFPGPRGYSPKTVTGFEFLVRSAARDLDPPVRIAKMPGNTCHFERIPIRGQAPIPVAAIARV